MQEPIPLKLESFKVLLPPRPADAHKGLFGHVLVIGGDYGWVGAVRLAAEAALRTGAGLVSVATRPEHVAAIISGRPEIMVHGIGHAGDLQALLVKATVIVLGPGLGQSEWSEQLFMAALTCPLPKVVDADALRLLQRYPHYADSWILTPHPGEAGCLLGVETAAIQRQRIASAKQIQAVYGGVVVLKGCGSLICTSNALSVCQTGNPGMASGGMGDVLSGVIAGLLAQGCTLVQAAEYGVCLHAEAGDLVAQQTGQRGMLASDLMPHLQYLVNFG